MKIYFASDHAGFEAKQLLIRYVSQLGYEVEDCGPAIYDKEDDYPEYIAKAAEEVSKDPINSKAIVLGGSGQGEAIVANKFPNVRAIVVYDDSDDIIKLSREHNDANILSIGARFMNDMQLRDTVKLWLETPFSKEERHERRIEEIENIEEDLYKNP